ncbi:MAG: formate--tetrahydrofolate ligase [Candidatus Puniceispirillales bacterium]
MSSDIEIARKAYLEPIMDVGAKLDIPFKALRPYGHFKAKLSSSWLENKSENKNAKLILVTAINPTPAGEGKTTTSVGLNDGLNKIGKKSIVCLREPSLGPCFGMKGGAAGGGYAQVVPMEDINLHFTGDFHAITSAHNLLSAMIDNHIYWGNKQEIDPRRVSWKRVVDMNDRALRNIVVSLGGVSNGFPRESGFDITVASEIMAILCLSENLYDLEKKLGDIIIGYRRDKTPVYCRDINADGAMTVLLKEAMLPNLVQTLENNPAFIHGGPFANIAHGCNSLVATRAGLNLGDYVVTEAGFGADLGAEKFLNIKCRKANLKPDAVVLVATIRALKMNGGVPRDQLENENVEALEKGSVNVLRHIENIKKFNLPVVVGINHFVSDTEEEVNKLLEIVSESGSEAIVCKHWSDGSEGTKELAKRVVEVCESGEADFQPLYKDEVPLLDKIKCVATEIYRASDISADIKIINQLKDWEKAGYGNLPVCMAKTQYSFSADPKSLGAPDGHILPIREVRLSAGAGFIVAICGDIMTMPGLPSVPAAEKIHIDGDNLVQGLF